MIAALSGRYSATGTQIAVPYSPAKLKARRLALGLFQTQVAERCGWKTTRSYQRLEEPYMTRVTPAVLARVAASLECRVEDLVESAEDRVAGLHAILSCCQTPADVEPAIGELFAEDFAKDAVNFSTIHRAKGAEADTIWYLQAPVRTPKQVWEVRQFQNLHYVALTRSRNRLTFVSLGNPLLKGRDR